MDFAYILVIAKAAIFAFTTFVTGFSAISAATRTLKDDEVANILQKISGFAQRFLSLK